ncbi:hypothetical protein Poly21_56830 [Allorhodopirellula heiligendammensis]|uniref:Uncharacterized protein n=2 Tax=Allorhodopirellula heiligendammensis TaxID=2714739 RepID=A0A5C6B1Q7_9BACT|nr:hypothetical protein Poly21_56830 [Allorhodopirellula heiligendammensis]
MHTIDELKSLVYGRGRGTGIKIAPCRYEGNTDEQILSLARDTATAVKIPADEEAITMTKHGNALSQLLESEADADIVADALIRYVQSRLEWTGRGAVE